MKKIALLVSIGISLISCNKDGYEVSGTIKGLENGKKVFIEVFDDLGMPISLDTTTVENEKFEFEGKLKNGIELAIVKFEDNVSLPIILENGSIKVEAIKDSIQGKIGGSKNNDLFQSFNNLNKSIMNKANAYQKANNEKYMNAMQNQDMETIISLQNDMKKFSEELNKNSKEFIAKNPDAYVSLLLLDSFLKGNVDTKENLKTSFAKLDKSLQDSKFGVKFKKALEEKTPEMNMPEMEPKNNPSTEKK